MNRSFVLCEGPEDLAALREIAKRYFGNEVVHHGTYTGAGQERLIRLKTPAGGVVDVLAVTGASSELANHAADKLAQLPPQVEPLDPERLGRLLLSFDPDVQTSEELRRVILQAVGKRAPRWTITQRGDALEARRDEGAQVEIGLVPWRAPGAIVDALPDHQNLDRVMTMIAARSYPDLADRVEKWLEEIAELAPTHANVKPSWKSAVHLWCALVEPRARESTAPERFFGQNKVCEAHALGVLKEVSLWEDWNRVFA